MFKSCSPYLKYFCDRGVKWRYSLTDRLLESMKSEDKLLFLHIGDIGNIISRESSMKLFNNEEVISLLNENFIPIIEDKIDRPHIYQLAQEYLLFGGELFQGEINLFLLPNLTPIMAFSTIEPESFISLANSLLIAKEERRERLEELAKSFTSTVIPLSPIKEGERDISFSTEEPEAEITSSLFVESWFKQLFHSAEIYRQTPFTPNPSAYLSILTSLKRGELLDGDAVSVRSNRERIKATLEHLQDSPLFDPISGGFFKEAVDYSCTLPLFEKSMEQNALFMLLYATAYQLFKENSFKESVLNIANFLKMEGRDSEGGVISTTTLLNPLEESDYYWFSPNELRHLFPGSYKEVAAALNISLKGEGKRKEMPTRGESFESLTKEELRKLRERRGEHRGFLKDERVVTSTNALVVTALARSSALLERASLLDEAIDLFDFLLNSSVERESLTIYRYRCNEECYLSGALLDWARVIEAAIELHIRSDNISYLKLAKSLVDKSFTLFWDESSSHFLDSSKREMARNSLKGNSLFDTATPSANSIMAGNLLTLYSLSGNNHYKKRAEKLLSKVTPSLESLSTLLYNWGEKLSQLELLSK